MAVEKTKQSTAGIDSEYGQFIGGEEVPAASGETLSSINPARGEELCRVPASDHRDVERAVQAAVEAFPEWKRTTPGERSEYLRTIADRVQQNEERFARIETLDNGKPIGESRGSMVSTYKHYRYFSTAARHFEGKNDDYQEQLMGMTLREPLGVVGQIIPWNVPLLMAAWKIAPALAAGNCVVLKPAAETPIGVLEFMREIDDVLPDGVLNVITGSGEAAGKPLVEHPDVRKVAFTGSTEVGRKILRYSADKIIPVTLELGGKSPQVVFEDANWEQALAGTAVGIFSNQGENCTAGSRLLVQESIHASFVNELADIARGIVVGDPMDEETEMGALVSKRQHEKVLSYVELGEREGARLVTGGSPPEDPALQDGFFFQPTIFDRVRNDSRIAQEEIFGPVLTVVSFEDYDEALRLANQTTYGLSAGVWTQDINRAHRAVRDLEAGWVWVNNYHSYPRGMPFGGYKQSGIGRETARETLEHYTRTKSAVFDFSGEKNNRYRIVEERE